MSQQYGINSAAAKSRQRQNIDTHNESSQYLTVSFDVNHITSCQLEAGCGRDARKCPVDFFYSLLFYNQSGPRHGSYMYIY